jgi:hypothetical protein
VPEREYDGAQPGGTPEIDEALVLVNEATKPPIGGRINEEFVSPGKLLYLGVGIQIKDRISVLDLDATFVVKVRFD